MVENSNRTWINTGKKWILLIHGLRLNNWPILCKLALYLARNGELTDYSETQNEIYSPKVNFLDLLTQHTDTPLS